MKKALTLLLIMGLFSKLFGQTEKKNSDKDVFGQNLPESYVKFLTDNPNGTEVAYNEYSDEDPDYEGRYWNIMGKSELLESWEMNGVGKAMNFECLKLYVQVQKEYGQGEHTNSNVGKIPLDRVESGFVIGDENGDYLYLDPKDNYSVWIYYHDGGDVLRISDSFNEFIND